MRRPTGKNEHYKLRYVASNVSKKSKTLMIWGAIWSSGLRTIVRLDMNDKIYMDILDRCNVQ